jgi:hypothetical protein
LDFDLFKKMNAQFFKKAFFQWYFFGNILKD